MIISLASLFTKLISASGKLITNNNQLILPIKNLGAVANNGQPIIDDLLAGSYGLKPQVPMTIGLSTNMTPPMG